jgi:hypothetical protein
LGPLGSFGAVTTTTLSIATVLSLLVSTSRIDEIEILTTLHTSIAFSTVFPNPLKQGEDMGL